jgi:predicted glycoside hydrolase/deacetylase ChbG (UPF0249 family)
VATPGTRLVVCADDYAITPGVSRGIRELLAARRISATSVMTGSEHWPAEAAALKAVAGDADIGLHVTLTDQKPIGPMPTFAPDGRFPSMGAVFKAGLLRRLPLAEIEREIARQVEAFVAHFGRAPDHIDGHHHVQQLPGVRDLVVATAARLGPGRIWVRSASEQARAVLARGIAVNKALAIGALGRGIARRAARAGVPVNRGFTGAYDFQADARPMAALFERFVAAAPDNTLLYCHPGYSDAALASLDVMTSARERELAYLMSPEWSALLQRRRLDVGPLLR